ncbi:MAG: hypothetical protein B7Y35_06145 [Sphingomonadales bacterium 28-64-96]|nr:MAG: hypothetical protein B7Y35_06145 [Sphingomonadales bacterium 28-64-96]
MVAGMTNVEFYALGLAPAVLIVLLLGSRGLWLAAAVMVLEFAASNGAVAASGRHDPAEAFAFLHFLCAWLLLRDSRHSAEVIIGGIYAVLFLIDGLYLALVVAHAFLPAWVSGPPSAGLYLWMTAGGGWAQIAALAAGGLADGTGNRSAITFAGARYRPVGVGAGLAVAGAAVLAGVAHAAGAA